MSYKLSSSLIEFEENLFLKTSLTELYFLSKLLKALKGL